MKLTLGAPPVPCQGVLLVLSYKTLPLRAVLVGPQPSRRSHLVGSKVGPLPTQAASRASFRKEQICTAERWGMVSIAPAPPGRLCSLRKPRGAARFAKPQFAVNAPLWIAMQQPGRAATLLGVPWQTRWTSQLGFLLFSQFGS